ncbi:MAG: SDR family NAD(P)-dependent oxidoreductase [Candidatus Hermodarchaeota archaeon]
MNFSNFFKGKVILVTGGTGSIGSEIVSQLLNYDPKAIRILSNSENELWETQLRFKAYTSKLRFLLGDIRDFERIKRAVKDVDIIFNAAAIKHVPISEYNPMEAINVNIHGLENIIEAAIYWNVEKVIHISTDKAINPTTVMGATKMLGERLLISRELAKGTSTTIISCVRFGNVLGSRGSIIPLFKQQIVEDNSITLTDNKMRRFFLSISQAVELVLKSAVLAQGGEIFVLKMPTILIRDLIEVLIEEYCPKIAKDKSSIEIKVIGPRAGEKMDEELISPIEFNRCYERDDMYIIYPLTYFDEELNLNGKKVDGIQIDPGKEFFYSTKNAPLLTKKEIKNILKEYKLLEI